MNSEEIIFRGKSQAGESYIIGHEEFNLPTMRYIVKRHPGLRNLYYKWDRCHGTEKPEFIVPDARQVFNDIWKRISNIQSGSYIIIANTHREMHIYKRMLKNSSWKIASDGLIYDVQPYIVISKSNSNGDKDGPF